MTGLDRKVAIVTGGGSGLGAAIAKRLATNGVRVMVPGHPIWRAELRDRQHGVHPRNGRRHRQQCVHRCKHGVAGLTRNAGCYLVDGGYTAV